MFPPTPCKGYMIRLPLHLHQARALPSTNATRKNRTGPAVFSLLPVFCYPPPPVSAAALCPPRAATYVATSPIVATPCGGFKAWESEESEEGPEGREGRERRRAGRSPKQQQQEEEAAAAAREKRRRIRRLSYVILALLGAVIACRWVGIG